MRQAAPRRPHHRRRERRNLPGGTPAPLRREGCGRGGAQGPPPLPAAVFPHRRRQGQSLRGHPVPGLGHSPGRGMDPGRRRGHRPGRQHGDAGLRRPGGLRPAGGLPRACSWTGTRFPGLADAVHSPFGASHYEFELAPKAWTLLSSLKSGTAVFTMPSGPIKCGGAAQKPMYLACDYWREQGVLDDIRVVMVQPYPTVYGVPGVDEELNRKIAEYGIELRLNSELASVDAAGQTAHDPGQRRRHHRGARLRRAQCRPAAVGAGLAQGHGPAGAGRRRRVRGGGPGNPPARPLPEHLVPRATPPRPPTPSAAARCASRPKCWRRTSWRPGRERR